MFVRAKRRERELARELRTSGLPYREIARRLAVSVNSAYRWTKDIELTPEQREHNLRGPTGPQNPDHIVDGWRHGRPDAERSDSASKRRGDSRRSRPTVFISRDACCTGRRGRNL